MTILARTGSLAVMALLVLAMTGCSDGYIRGARVSADHSTIFYETHELAGDLMVTDMSGTRVLDSRGPYDHREIAVTPDGRWCLAVIWDIRNGAGRSAGDRLTLVDARTQERFDERPPFDPAAWRTTRNAQRPMQGSLSPEVERTPVLVGNPVPVLIEDEPRIWFGPVDGRYLVWSPRETAAPWRWSDEATGPPSIANRVQLDLSGGSDPHPPEFVVVLPCDGWNARRTVWVRPDGEVVELTRQDDSPLLPLRWFAAFCGWHSFSPLGGIVGLPTMLVKAPGAVADQAQRDAEELKVAQEELRQAIERRRARRMADFSN